MKLNLTLFLVTFLLTSPLDIVRASDEEDELPDTVVFAIKYKTDCKGGIYTTSFLHSYAQCVLDDLGNGDGGDGRALLSSSSSTHRRDAGEPRRLPWTCAELCRKCNSQGGYWCSYASNLGCDCRRRRAAGLGDSKLFGGALNQIVEVTEIELEEELISEYGFTRALFAPDKRAAFWLCASNSFIREFDVLTATQLVSCANKEVIVLIGHPGD